MNKADKILIFSLILISVIAIVLLNINKNNGKKANVYYDNELILTIDLTKKEKQTFNVKGYNGDVHILVNNGKIKVDQEKSPLNLCSKQGYISSSYETIVCLPNKIVIKITDKEKIDTIVG